MGAVRSIAIDSIAEKRSRSPLAASGVRESITVLCDYQDWNRLAVIDRAVKGKIGSPG